MSRSRVDGGLVSAAGELVVGLRFLARLPRFLRRPVALAEARALLAARLARREADFLALVRCAVYERGLDPYRALLRHAGCEYGDLEWLVRADGLEAALRRLLEAGVYLTLDELKGRRPVVRGGRTFSARPADLWHPGAGARLLVRSGGTTGAPAVAPLVLEAIRDDARDLALVLDARGLTRAVHALWAVPGGSGLEVLLRFAGAGLRFARWFSPVDVTAPGLASRYRWSVRGVAGVSRLAGRPLPFVEPGPTEDPRPVLGWMAEVLGRGGVPHLWAMAHAGARLGEAARAAGVALAGAHATLGSEAVTPARVDALRAAGVTVAAGYASSECGLIGVGCLAAVAADEVHVLTDRHALVQSEDTRPAGPSAGGPLWLSSLRDTARMLLLNVSIGDRGAIGARRCGCPLEALGWTTHLHDIRSAEKLTVGGMALPDACVRAVLEEVLPRRFGGGVTDYQLVEEEGEAGRPILALRVHPRVGALDAGAVADAFLDGIALGSGIERVTALAWREAGLVRVERRPPLATAGGKVPLVQHRVAAGARAAGSGDPGPAGPLPG
jgi:hypothetical protein